MTKLYNHPDFWTPSQAAVDITRAQRSIFWLNNDYIVIYDRATSKSSGLFKRFNLSLVASPFMHGQDATEIMPMGNNSSSILCCRRMPPSRRATPPAT
jgi:hypothetical protein